MSTSGKLITTGVGDILFMAVNQPVINKKTDEATFEVSVLLDSKADVKVIAEIAAINPAIPVTAATYRGNNEKLKKELAKGKTKVSARTKYAPKLFDKEGNALEEAPSFFPDSTGQAQLILMPYTGSSKGGSVTLDSVIIHNIESGETDTESRAEKMAKLREMAVKTALGG